MIINQIKLRGFGKFRNKTVRFDDGFNLVLGPNEAGKSTVQAAIFCAFFGKPKDYEFWGEPGQPCRIELIYKVEGSTFNLIRDLATSELFLADQSDIIIKKTRAAKVIKEHLGIGDERIFENTVFVRVSELEPLHEAADTKKIKDRIETLVTGSRKVSATKAIQDLATVYKNVAGSQSQKGQGGQIGGLQSEIGELRKVLTEANNSDRRTEETRSKFDEISQIISEKNKQLMQLRPLLGAIQLMDQLNKAAKERLKLSQKIEQIEDLTEEKISLEKELAKNGLKNLPPDISRSLPIWDQDSKNKQETINEYQRSLQLIKGELIPNRLPAYAGGALLLMAVLTAVLINPVVGAIFLITAAAAITWGLIAGKGHRFVNNQVLETENKIGDLQLEVEKLRSSIENALKAAGCADISEFNLKFGKLSEKNNDLRLVTEKITLLCADTSLEAMKVKRRNLMDEEERLTGKLDDATRHALAALSPEEILAKQRLSERLDKEITQLNEERYRLEGRLEEMAGGRVTGEIEDDILFLQNRLKDAVLKSQAINLARETLEKATEDLSRQIVPKITERATGYFSKFTLDKSRELHLDERLELTFGGGQKKSADFLSTGTGDQAFFALRLAIGQLITDEARPPLILDDPFAFFDEERLKGAMEILITIASEQQIILFSHDNIYRRWPLNIIEL